MDDSVLECRNLLMGESSKTPVSFVLHKGDLVSIKGEAALFFDIIQGLKEPHSGDVLFMGMQWNDMSAFNDCRGRGMIGRLFPEAEAWVQNLSLIENIKLCQLHHRFTAARELDAMIASRARSLDLGDFLKLRPENIPHDDLARAQLLRLFFRQTRVLLFEKADAVVKGSYCEVFKGWVNEFLGAGGIVVDCYEGEALIAECSSDARRIISGVIDGCEISIDESARKL